MNLADLRDRRRRERGQDSLQSLPETFYGDVAGYLRELKTAREEAAEQATDPYGDPEVRRLTDELQTAESIVESLYERRVGKVVKHASFAAADMPHEREGLTEEERALFDDLVGRIEENRTRVLDTLAGEGEADEDDPERRTPAESTPTAPTAPSERSSDVVADRDDPAGMLADAMGVGDGGSPETNTDAPTADGGSSRTPADEPARDTPPATGDGQAADTDTDSDPHPDPEAEASGAGTPAERTTVKITADIGEIYGVDDRDYHLEAEDVVDLPADNAAPLIEKEAAERL